ncbi:MAG: GNAT family N-acetyltransferase [Azoarcus sp.]|jgi:L-amino acid N-acyltransferase YncA|nr:GNAT family N-acetyltransferase [Azoarcus sp.]
MTIKNFLRRAALSIFDEYRLNWIVASRTSKKGEMPNPLPDDVRPETHADWQQLLASLTAKMRNTVNFSRAGMDGFVLEADGRLACVAHVADRTNYNRDGTWPLHADEVAVMDIATEETMRGHGLGAYMLSVITDYYLGLGKCRVIGFIWWTNSPSLRAFTKAGWRRIGFSIEWSNGKKWRSIKIPLPIVGIF